jgi:hypothetical protein
MLDLVARLLVALSVAVGGGVATAGDHASPNGHQNAFDAIEAIIARATAAVEQAQPTSAGRPEATGLDRAQEVANDHAADGLGTAVDAAGADHDAKPEAAGDGASALEVEAPPVGTPPVDTPAANGPPESKPPVPAPPISAPPVDAPGQGNRP